MLEYTKQKYVELLMNNNAYKDAHKKSLLDVYEPLLEKRFTHAEEIPLIKDYNTMLLECVHDLSGLQYEIAIGANALKELSDSITLRLETVEQLLLEEKIIRDNMKILCNAYENFDDMIIADKFMADQTCRFDKGYYTAGVSSSEDVLFDIIEVNGNGMAGNKYVLNTKDEFIEKTINSHLTQALKDSEKQTYYDYQRLTLASEDNYFAPDMYQDNIPARCDILVKAKKTVENCIIYGNTSLLNGLFFSQDGVSFSNALKTPVTLNKNNQVVFNEYLAFPSAQYLRFSFESIDNSSENLGFMGYGSDSSLSALPESEKLYKIKSGKRRLIRLNELVLESHKYVPYSYYKTSNVLPYPVQCVALYAEVYCPEHIKYPDEYLSFQLLINNKAYDVMPINSHTNGCKIIATSAFDINAKYSGVYIDEPIVDARIVMNFNCKTPQESAVVKNLRLLIGESYES